MTMRGRLKWQDSLAKCRKYQEQCETWTDYRIIRLILMENDPEMDPKRLPALSTIVNGKENFNIESLWDYFNSTGNGDGLTKFISSLELSLQKPSFFHLGHHSLLKLLTSKNPNDLLKSSDYECNLKIQKIIQGKICYFIGLVNIQELLPVMESKQLLTNRDKELLGLCATCTDKADHLLTKLLCTKGHCGYKLFLECLEDEQNHMGHYEIANKITTELWDQYQICHDHLLKCSVKEVQVWYQCKGLMNTHKYIEATEIFMYLSQSNNVHKFYNKLKVFISSNKRTPETEAFGFIMEALSLKLRYEDTKFCDVIVKAEQCISHIKDDDNKRNLTGNWYLVLSCWYRHQRKFQNAREYLEKAKSELRSSWY